MGARVFSLKSAFTVGFIVMLFILVFNPRGVQAQGLDALGNALSNVFQIFIQPIRFASLVVPAFGNDTNDVYRFVGIQPPSSGDVSWYILSMGGGVTNFYYNTLLPISIGLAGFAILIGTISLLFEGLGFLREGEAFTTIKWAFLSPILAYIFPYIWNILAILTAEINSQISSGFSLGLITSGSIINSALSGIGSAIGIVGGISATVLLVGLIFMFVIYAITMIVFGSVRIVMMVAFVLLTPVFLPLMKIPTFGGIFKKFTIYAIEMLVATIVAAMLMTTVGLLLTSGLIPEANRIFLFFGLLFVLIFVPFISLFVTNWVLGTAAGVVAAAAEHALEKSAGITAIGTGVLRTAGGILGGTAIAGGTATAITSGGKATRILGNASPLPIGKTPFIGKTAQTIGTLGMMTLPASATIGSVLLGTAKITEPLALRKHLGDINKYANKLGFELQNTPILPPSILEKWEEQKQVSKASGAEKENLELKKIRLGVGAWALGKDPTEFIINENGKPKFTDKGEKVALLGEYIISKNRQLYEQSPGGYVKAWEKQNFGINSIKDVDPKNEKLSWLLSNPRSQDYLQYAKFLQKAEEFENAHGIKRDELREELGNIIDGLKNTQLWEITNNPGQGVDLEKADLKEKIKNLRRTLFDSTHFPDFPIFYNNWLTFQEYLRRHPRLSNDADRILGRLERLDNHYDYGIPALKLIKQTGEKIKQEKEELKNSIENKIPITEEYMYPHERMEKARIVKPKASTKHKEEIYKEYKERIDNISNTLKNAFEKNKEKIDLRILGDPKDYQPIVEQLHKANLINYAHDDKTNEINTNIVTFDEHNTDTIKEMIEKINENAKRFLDEIMNNEKAQTG
jgi:hypothetical protein